jgi:3-methyladenine DNA glycosylase AlkD
VITVKEIARELEKLADAEQAVNLQRFFKTGPGEYGEGDLFRGIKLPPLRGLARTYRDAPLKAITALLHSRHHEDRTLALFILVDQYKRGDEAARKTIYDLYLANTRYVNNWDLVDQSAPTIVGLHLLERSRSSLLRMARSKSLWERRIAVLATFQFIKHGEFEDATRVAEILLEDKEDLIHKAVGWMIREIGNRDPAAERKFLAKHYREMPRTMLRYAIEKFPEKERLSYLKGTA